MLWSFNYLNLLRNIMVDNSRIDKKRTPPKDLIDIKKGIFTVPNKAGGKLHPLKKELLLLHLNLLHLVLK